MALYVAWTTGKTILKVLTKESGHDYIQRQAPHLRDKLKVIEKRNHKEANGS